MCQSLFFAAARVKIFFVTRISGNKSNFFLFLDITKAVYMTA